MSVAELLSDAARLTAICVVFFAVTFGLAVAIGRVLRLDDDGRPDLFHNHRPRPRR